jgi:hypothetical protein
MGEFVKNQKPSAQYPCGSWRHIGLQTAWDMRDGLWKCWNVRTDPSRAKKSRSSAEAEAESRSNQKRINNESTTNQQESPRIIGDRDCRIAVTGAFLKNQKPSAQYPCGSWRHIGLQSAWDMRDGLWKCWNVRTDPSRAPVVRLACRAHGICGMGCGNVGMLELTPVVEMLEC